MERMLKEPLLVLNVFVSIREFIYLLQAVSMWWKTDILGFVREEDDDSIRKESPHSSQYWTVFILYADTHMCV